ncbi:MAG: integrin alpha [Pseudomonadota bacterium]
MVFKRAESYSLSGAVDINADGVDDVLIGGEPGYVFFGDLRRLLATHDLPEIDHPNAGGVGYSLVSSGQGFNDHVFVPVDGAGDVNGDGVQDLIVGLPGRNSAKGSSIVIFGTTDTFGGELELENLQAGNGGDGSLGFVMDGFHSAARAGFSVSAAGDVNNDGFDDVIVGSPGSWVNSFEREIGQAFVVYGTDQGFDADLPLDTLLTSNGGDGTRGFAMNGIVPGDRAGSAVGGVGDVNGDGIADVIVSAIAADPGGREDAGESYLVFGSATGFPAEFELADLLPVNGGNGSKGVVIRGIAAGDRSGEALAAAGDINHDGIADVIIGAANADPGGRQDAGEVYVLFGTDAGFPAVLELSALQEANGGNGETGFVLTGITTGNLAGTSVDGAGDINNDGIDDLIVGAVYVDLPGRPEAGQAYVVYGSSSGFAAEFRLYSLLSGDGVPGFMINGASEDDLAGWAVGAAGDINGDGLDDIAISAPFARNMFCCQGRVYVVFGRTDADSDGVSDTLDNCLVHDNPDQADVDEDGFGTACDADFNNDCMVNFTDLVMFRENFYSSDALYDLDQSGVVDFVDLGLLKSLFFAEPGPSALTSVCLR